MNLYWTDLTALGIEDKRKSKYNKSNQLNFLFIVQKKIKKKFKPRKTKAITIYEQERIKLKKAQKKIFYEFSLMLLHTKLFCCFLTL